MVKKKILIILLAVIILGGGGLVYKFLSVPQEKTNLVVGGDKDEHGCIGSAGYTWCGAKEKCIRIFEEDCLSAEEVKKLIASKYNKPVSDVFIRIDKENSEYAKGGVSFAPQGGPGGIFLATKISGKWELVYDGNGSIDCDEITKNYEFSQEMLAGLCD